MGFNFVDLHEDPHKRLLRRATHSTPAAPRNDAEGVPATNTILPRIKSTSSPPYIHLTFSSTGLFLAFYTPNAFSVNLVPA